MVATTDSYGQYVEATEHGLSFAEIEELMNYFVSVGVLSTTEGKNGIDVLKSKGYGVGAKLFTRTIEAPGAYIYPGQVVVMAIWKE